MSLLNLVVQPDCAYVVADSGYYGEGGVVTRLGPKTMVLENLNLIVASAGSLNLGQLAATMGDRQFATQEALIEALPEVARKAVEAFAVQVPSMVVAAGYSEQRRAAFGRAFVTHAAGGKVRPVHYQLIERAALLLPPLPGVPLAPLTRPTAFDPCGPAMLGLVERQRQFDFSSAERPEMGCCIAGDIEVTAVSAAGISVTRIHSYPATVGEKVQLEKRYISSHQFALLNLLTPDNKDVAQELKAYGVHGVVDATAEQQITVH